MRDGGWPRVAVSWLLLILTSLPTMVPVLGQECAGTGAVDRDEGRGNQRFASPSRARFALGRRLTIDAGESTEDVIAILAPVIVRGEVRGTVLALGGRVVIDGGSVSDSVAAIGGSVQLRDDARVGGDVLSIGGSVTRAGNARIRGAITEVASNGLPVVGGWFRDEGRSPWRGLRGRVGLLVLLLVASSLIMFVAERTTSSVVQRVAREPIQSGLVGLVVQILAVPLLVLMTVTLAVSIIGIPLLPLVPVTVVILGLASLVGYACCALVVGRALSRRGQASGSIITTGVAAIQGAPIAGGILYGLGGPFGPFGLLLLLLGLAIQYLAWTAGLGAVVLQVLTPAPGSSR